jgi:hypothetical protein
MQIYKYALNRVIAMPQDAKILTIQIDQKDNLPYLWAMVDLNKESENRYFEIIGTGWSFIPDTLNYIATYQEQELIWHVFERFN